MIAEASSPSELGSFGAHSSGNLVFSQVDSLTATILKDTRQASLLGLRSVVEAMESAESARCRTPLRDLAAHMVPFISEPSISKTPEALSLTVRALRCSGRGMVYFQEFFEYLVGQREALSPSDLAILIHECGRHGLRSKHYLDILVKSVPSQVPKMDRSSLSLCLKGVCKFAGDYVAFSSALVKRTSFNLLSSDEVLVLMRVLRATGDADAFTQLVRRTDFESFPIVHKFSAIYLMKRSRNFALDANQRKASISATEALVRDVSLLPLSGDVITTDLTDCLDAIASWKIRDTRLMESIMAVLTDRVAEIKYSPICGLWQSVTDSLGHLSFFDAKWMRTVDELASSEFNLRSFAAFQLIFFTSSLGRLNYCNEKIFSAIVSVVTPDISTVNDADMLATLLFPLERIAFDCPDLVDAVINQISKIVRRPNQGSRGQFRGVLTATYACVSLGASVDDPRFVKLTEFLFTQKSYSFMNDLDYVRLCRLEAVGLFPQGVPESLTQSSHYALWPNSEHRRRVMDEYFRDGAVRVTNCPFIDLQLADGTLIVVPSQEEVMRQWKHPNDSRNVELVPLETNGTREFIARFLSTKGVRFAFAPSS